MVSVVHTIPFVAATGGPSTVTPVIGVEDTNWVPGDVAAIICLSRTTVVRTWANLDGWAGQTQGNSSATIYLSSRVYLRRLETGDGNPTFSHSSGGGGVGAFGVILRGVDAATILDVAPATNESTGVTATAPSVTTVTDDAFLLRFWLWSDNGTAIGTYSIGSEIYEYITDNTSLSVSGSTQETAGASGTATAVASGGDIGGTDRYVTHTIAIRPLIASGDSDLTVTPDTIATGGTVTATLSVPFDDPISILTLEGGDTLTPESGADEEEADFTIPGMAECSAGGDLANTRIGEALDVTVGDGADTSEPSLLTITPQTGYLVATMALAWPDMSAGAQSWIPNDVDAGNQIWVRSTDGAGLVAFAPNGDLILDGPSADIEFNVFRIAWGTPATQEVSPTDFAGLLYDSFPDANGTSLEGKAPESGDNDWSVAKLTAASASPTGQVTVQGGLLSIAAENAGAEYDIEANNFRLIVRFTASASDTRNITFRREGEGDYLALNINQSLQRAQLVRRIGGTQSVIAAITPGFETVTGQEYIFDIRCDGNTVSIIRDEVEIFSEQVATNQAAGATRVGLFAGGSGFPITYSEVTVYQIAPPVLPQDMALDKADYVVGDTIVWSLSPEDNIPSGATLYGIAIDIESGATTATGESIAPSLSDCLSGDWTTLPWYVPVDFALTFADDPTVTAGLQIVGPAGNESASTHWHGLTPETPEGGWPEGSIYSYTQAGGAWYASVSSGTIQSIDEDGVFDGSAAIVLYGYIDGEWESLYTLSVPAASFTSISPRNAGEEATITVTNSLEEIASVTLAGEELEIL